MKNPHMNTPITPTSSSLPEHHQFQVATRFLSWEGIHFCGWVFQSPAFGQLLLRNGPRKYELLYSALDASVVYVLPTKAKAAPVLAFNTLLEGSKLGFSTAHDIRKKASAECGSPSGITFEAALKSYLSQLKVDATSVCHIDSLTSSSDKMGESK